MLTVLLVYCDKTAEEVSAATGIHRSLISRFRTASRPPTAEQYEILANYFHVSVEDLKRTVTFEELLEFVRKRRPQKPRK